MSASGYHLLSAIHFGESNINLVKTVAINKTAVLSCKATFICEMHSFYHTTKSPQCEHFFCFVLLKKFDNYYSGTVGKKSLNAKKSTD